MRLNSCKDREWLHELISHPSINRADTAIFVIANVTESDLRRDITSRENEYFTDLELMEIVNGFRDGGFYCDYFLGESDFIRWVEGGGLRHFPIAHRYVYNTAQSGTGPGRKSLIPSFCDLHKISRLNSDAYTASLARHKFHTHCVLEHAGIKTPRTWWYLPDGSWFADNRPPEKTLVITKSTYESASIGVTLDGIFKYTTKRDSWLHQISKKLQQGAVVQELISGWEVEVPILVAGAPKALAPVCVGIDGDPKMEKKIFHFTDVRSESYEFFELPSEIRQYEAALRSISERVAYLLGFRGAARIDFRISQQGELKIIDVATTPHLVKHSSYSYRFLQLGLPHSSVFSALVAACAS